MSRAGNVPFVPLVGFADVEELDRIVGRLADSREWRLRPDERAAVELDDPFHVRGARRRGAEGGGDEVGELALECVIEAPLETDRRRRLRAHRGAAQRAGDVAGKDL